MATPEQITRENKPLVTRAIASFRANTYNEADRTVTVSLGTGADYERYDRNTGKFFIERLSMEPGAVRLERMNSGAQFLVDHEAGEVENVVGVFVRNTVRVENGELIGLVKLSAAARSADTVRDIVDGILSQTSVGYLVYAEESKIENGQEIRTATDWEPYEGSIVCVPADVTGGIRSADAADVKKEAEMADVTVTETAATEAVPAVETVVAVDERAIEARGADLERARYTEIRAYGRKFGMSDAEIDGMVANKELSADGAIRQMADKRAAQDGKMETNSRVDVTTDVSDKRRNLLVDAMLARGGVQKGINPDAQREFGGLSCTEIVREVIGADAARMTKRELFTRMTSSDFPLLLANTANKALIMASEAMQDYKWFEKVFTRMDYNDFKPHATPWLGHTAVLPTVVEGDDYTLGTMTERNESSTAVKYGKDFSFTYEMMVNDDLGAFVNAPMEIAEAAIRTQSALCAALLTGNQTMGDGVVLFHAATHKNLSTSGGAPDVAKLNELWQMLLDATEDGVRVGRRANFLLIPSADQPTIESLYATPRVMPDYTTAALVAGIAPENRIVVPSFTGTPYYMATGARNAARYGYLRDEGGLVVTQYPNWKADATVFHAHVTFGCHINKWQDFASNPGA